MNRQRIEARCRRPAAYHWLHLDIFRCVERLEEELGQLVVQCTSTFRNKKRIYQFIRETRGADHSAMPSGVTSGERSDTRRNPFVLLGMIAGGGGVSRGPKTVEEHDGTALTAFFVV